MGAMSIDNMAKFGTPQAVKELLDLFYSLDYGNLDTAQGYSPHDPGTSEPLLGAVDGGKRFNTSTKIYPYGDHSHSGPKIEQNISESLGALNVAQVDIEYLHVPDRTTPFEETCESMDKAYREGKFRRFGLSNHTAEEVEKIVQICEARELVKPSVYQGQYNAIVRGGELEVFTVLRKHGIAFCAWRYVVSEPRQSKHG
jgi:aflatoxin B1 aldehyde reductase